MWKSKDLAGETESLGLFSLAIMAFLQVLQEAKIMIVNADVAALNGL